MFAVHAIYNNVCLQGPIFLYKYGFNINWVLEYLRQKAIKINDYLINKNVETLTNLEPATLPFGNDFQRSIRYLSYPDP